jgi:hypothetical protein
LPTLPRATKGVGQEERLSPSTLNSGDEDRGRAAAVARVGHAAYLDWKLQFWHCHFWEKPPCSIYDFDDSKSCTRCVIDCYRDASTMQHIAVSGHDALRSLRSGDLAGRGEGAQP